MHPSHTFIIQQALWIDCIRSSGKGSEQMGQSSSNLVRPFFISTSRFPAATHSSHILMLSLRPRCSSLYAPSGSSRSQAPQINIAQRARFGWLDTPEVDWKCYEGGEMGGLPRFRA